MTYETILFEQSADKVATITINRPEALNSFTRTMCLEFREVWERIRLDNTINAVVLRASPGPRLPVLAWTCAAATAAC